MFITGTIIAASLYTLGKELHENYNKKTKRLTAHLSKENVYRTEGKHPLIEMVSAIKGDERKKQHQELSATKKSDSEKIIDRNIAICGGMLGISIVAPFVYPPLLLLLLPGAVFVVAPIAKKAYTSLVKEKKVVLEVADVTFQVSTFVLGYYVIVCLDTFLYFIYRKSALRTEDQSVKKLVNMTDDLPQTVWIVKKGVEIEIPLEKLQIDEIISVSAGQMIPADGIITHGFAIIDEQMLTGEAQSAEKNLGDNCFASTLILEGSIHIQVKKIGADTVVYQIGEALNKSLDYRDEVIAKGQEVSDKSTVPMLLLAGASFPFVGWAGSVAIIMVNYGYNIRGINPFIVLNYLLIASQEGILIKDGRALEAIHKMDTVIFDKTGTLTLSQPSFKAIYAKEGYSENDLLTLAAGAEYKQSHPIALAILEEAEARQLVLPSIEHAKYEVGYGLKVEIEGKAVLVGSSRFMEMESIFIPADLQAVAKAAHITGSTFVYIAVDQELKGAIELSPTIRPEAKRVIKDLKARNISCFIISGDHTLPTKYLAEELGVQDYFAEVLPEEKANLVEQFQQQGKTVCFIGDGINDSIALKKANVSISMRGATTLATDTAQIILLDETLNQIPLLFELGEQFNESKDTNLFTAISICALTISGIFFLNFGVLAAFVSVHFNMFTGVLHSLRPLLHYHDAKKQKGLEIEKNENEPKRINSDIKKIGSASKNGHNQIKKTTVLTLVPEEEELV